MLATTAHTVYRWNQRPTKIYINKPPHPSHKEAFFPPKGSRRCNPQTSLTKTTQQVPRCFKESPCQGTAKRSLKEIDYSAPYWNHTVDWQSSGKIIPMLDVPSAQVDLHVQRTALSKQRMRPVAADSHKNVFIRSS